MKREEEGCGISHIRKRSRLEDRALPSRTWHHVCRQEMAPESSQQLRAQEAAPVRRCGIERRTRHQGREGGNGDGNRDGDGNEDEDGNGYEDRNGDGSGSGNEDEN
ncbi:unnamed protein product [Ascophyllum nodosum]